MEKTTINYAFAMVTLLLGTGAAAESADPPLPIASYQTVCVDSQDLTALVDEFKELPYVRGITQSTVIDSANLPMVIFVNPETGTFTIAERTGADTFCLLAVGSGFSPVPRQIQDDVRDAQNKSSL